MTIHIDKLIELLAKIFEDRNIKATGSRSLKGGLVTGLSAIIGGLLLGPMGLAVGGTLGGVCSAITMNDFQPIPVILKNMSASEKKILADYLVTAFRDFGPNDVIALTMLLTARHDLQDHAFRLVGNYLANEMQMRIQS